MTRFLCAVGAGASRRRPRPEHAVVLAGLVGLIAVLSLGGLALRGFGPAEGVSPVQLMALEGRGGEQVLGAEGASPAPVVEQPVTREAERVSLTFAEPIISDPADHTRTMLRMLAPGDEAPPAVRRSAPASAEEGRPMFNGRPLRKAGEITMTVTAYSPDARSCGKWADGITASGYSVWTNGMKLVAADTSLLPFGTIITVPGYNNGKPVPVLDRGGAIKGRRLDVLYPTHEVALQWGVRETTVTVWEYAD